MDNNLHHFKREWNKMEGGERLRKLRKSITPKYTSTFKRYNNYYSVAASIVLDIYIYRR